MQKPDTKMGTKATQVKVAKQSLSKKTTTFYNKKKVGKCKVQLFWEDHKNVRNRPYGFEIYLVNVKTIRTIAQIFVAFSEKLNFTA